MDKPFQQLLMIQCHMLLLRSVWCWRRSGKTMTYWQISNLMKNQVREKVHQVLMKQGGGRSTRMLGSPFVKCRLKGPPPMKDAGLTISTTPVIKSMMMPLPSFGGHLHHHLRRQQTPRIEGRR